MGKASQGEKPRRTGEEGGLCLQQQPDGQTCTQETCPTQWFRSRQTGAYGGKGAGNGWAFPVSTVRLVPKANGVRTITNLSKRSWVDRNRVQWVRGVPLPVRESNFLRREFV